jgi:tRNA threonylcarbamoyladenosine biosynthesis protein TsaE
LYTEKLHTMSIKSPNIIMCDNYIIKLYKEVELPYLAEKLVGLVRVGNIIHLHGEIGVGKTVLVRCIIQAMYNDSSLIVKSPTFSIVEEYSEICLAHFDFYRLDKRDAVECLDPERYSEMLCFVEWPYKGPEFLQNPDLVVSIRYIDTHTREISLISLI